MGTTVEPLFCGHHRDHAMCQEYRGVHISEACDILLVGEALYTCAVKLSNKSMFQGFPLLYAGKKG